MRPIQLLRRSRPVHLGATVLMLAIPASAVALTAGGHANGQSAIQIDSHTRHVSYGHDLTLDGFAGPGEAGRPLQLQYALTQGGSWHAVSTAKARTDGSFRLLATLRRSGLVRVVASGGGALAPGAATGGTGAVAPSATARVSVHAHFLVRPRLVDVLEGQPMHVSGKLLPAGAGRVVRLVGRSGTSWRTLASARTGARGRFDLRYSAGATGARWLRVRFQGDRLNAASWAHAGHLTVFRESVASWYTDGGGTACGFHAHYGVANRTLPCGTKVTFHANGRSVTGVVDDRGPFVGGREWDLNQNVAGALGFGGVGTVWSSI